MSYANIVVSVDAGETSCDRVHAAAGLAERFGALLTGVAADSLIGPRAVTDTGEAQALLEEEHDNLVEALAATRAAFERGAGDRVRTRWHQAESDAVTYLVRQARTADLVVVGRHGPTDEAPGAMGVDPGTILIEAGRPVLVVPPGIAQLKAARIVVAWKDTAEARRAVAAAVPFVCFADQVFVVSAGENARSEGAEDVAKLLARHGAHVTTHFLTAPTDEIAWDILRFAFRQGADLVVMGGYSHSRLRERIFGGVTHDFLRLTPLCCLMSH